MTTTVTHNPVRDNSREEGSGTKYSIEGYFNNNGGGHQKFTTIAIPSQNISVQLYYNHLEESKRQTIQREILSAAQQFFQEFTESATAEKSTHSGQLPTIFKLYLFNNKEDYQHLGGREFFNWGLGNEGGKAYYFGRPDLHSALYVYQQGDTLNLKHELTHALTFYLAQGKSASAPNFVMEGVAEYSEHPRGVVNVKAADYADVTFDTLKKLSNSANPQENNLLYRMGHAVVSYLQAQYPGRLSQYFIALGNGQPEQADELLQSALGQAEPLKRWLSEHSFEKLFQKANLLQAKPESCLGTRITVVGDQRKPMRYHQAVITTQDQRPVGRFSPIVHLWNTNTVQVSNRATGEALQIPEEYRFLKVFTTPQGDQQLLYCNKQGELYTESQHYRRQVLNRLGDRNPALQAALRAAREAAQQKQLTATDRYRELSKAYQQLQRDHRTGSVSYEAMAAKHKELSEAHAGLAAPVDEEVKQLETDFYVSLFTKTEAEAVARIASNPTYHTAYQQSLPHVAAFESLLQINQYQLSGIKKRQLQRWAANGKVLGLKNLGQGDKSALSIYNGARKVGELTTEIGFFRKIEADSLEDTTDYPQEFIYEDALRGLYVEYKDPHLAVTGKDGSYQLSFIEDNAPQGDRHAAVPHFHQNELLKPGIQHMSTAELQPLLLQGEILNQAGSLQAQYTEEQRQHGTIVKKGELFDNKGTERTDDDNYRAVVTQGGRPSHSLAHIGLYISEEIKNRAGEITSPSLLLLHDHGRGLRWQLPAAITHLKLLKDAKGERKLVPCDVSGDERPVGMPAIPDAYRFLDLSVAHQYTKKEYSSQHINTGPVNFDAYSEGTRFAIKYDPQDPAIPRDERGNVVRSSDTQIYFTKVKLWDGKREIGMLANSHHQFTGKIFFSADRNHLNDGFLASVSPQLVVEEAAEGGQKISFKRGDGDVAGTDRGYTDHQRMFIPSTAPTSPPKQLVASMAALNQAEVGAGAQHSEPIRPPAPRFSNRIVRTG